MLDKLDIFRKKKRSVIAIDGKTISGIRNDKHKAYHVVSAFVAENQIYRTNEKGHGRTEKR